MILFFFNIKTEGITCKLLEKWSDYDFFAIGNDYGIGNVSISGLFDIHRSESDNSYHLLDKYYHYANTHNQQLTDEKIYTQIIRVIN